MMDKFLIAFSLVVLAACGGPSGTPSITVTGPGIGLKIGEATTMTANFKDASGNAVTKNFTWTSSAPNIAAVDSGGKVTAKRIGPVKITASSDGVSGSSDQFTYGLEVVGGTISGFADKYTALLIRFKNGNGQTIPAGTPLPVSVTGPSGWNANVPFSPAGLVFNDQNFAVYTWFGPKGVLTGNYQASATVAGTTYTSNFAVDATQVQAPVVNPSITSVASNSVAVAWTAPAGAASYQAFVQETVSLQTQKIVTQTTTGTTFTGLVFESGKSYQVGVDARNFDLSGPWSVPAPTQFNFTRSLLPITF